ncbi:MAG: hypothetical protein QG620_448 [Patescibacteria group bacterium]|nr:hypothetical protein [Patescibacteria group bacterium]
MLLRTLPLLDDFEHTIITLKKRGELANKFEEKNIPLINIEQKNFFNIRSYRQLLKTVKNTQPDLVVTYLFHADAIGRLFLQVFTNTKIIPFLRTTYNHKKYFSAQLFEKLTKHFVKNYLANSQSVKNFYVKNIGVPPEKITVIPNGIDVDFYDKIKRDENLRKSLGIKKEETAIICVANLHINKGHKYLLEAFEEVYRENKGLKLLLVGDGEEKENLLKQVKNYQSEKNILFLGKRNDVPQLLKISDIFILPTLFEGMSNAIIEAMAAEVPIITTDIPENHNLIENKKSGLLFPADNVRRLVKAIELLTDNSTLRKKFSQNSLQRAKEKFDIQTVVNQLTNFFEEI